MKYITKFLLLIICTQIYFLDVIGCGSTSKKIKFFSYDGQNYTCEVNEKLGRYANLESIGNDYNSKEGYTFVGWAVLPYSKEDITTLDGLEASEDILYISKYLPYPNLDELEFYPILIRNDIVEDFYQNSNLSKIVIEVIYSYPYKNGTKHEVATFEGRINQTFIEMIGNIDTYYDEELDKTFEFKGIDFDYRYDQLDIEQYPPGIGTYRITIHYE